MPRCITGWMNSPVNRPTECAIAKSGIIGGTETGSGNEFRIWQNSIAPHLTPMPRHRRLAKVTDATGAREYGYDIRGQVVKLVRAGESQISHA